MQNELRFLGLTPLFGAVGAMATAAAWHLYAILFLEMVPAQLAVLACLVAGLVGPAAVWITVWITTRPRRTTTASAVRRAASLGLGLVLAAEIGFYIPLGFFAIAFY
jgi:hypothetical protein